MEFLEDVIAGQKNLRSLQLPALEITQAWSKLRAPDQTSKTLQHLLMLLDQHARSLHLGDAQVRLLISLARLPAPSVELSGSIKSSAARVISVWVRRCFLSPHKNVLSSSSAIFTLRNVAETFSEFLQEEPDASCELFVCPVMLLLGAAAAAAPESDVKTKLLCQTALVEELTIRKRFIVKNPQLPEVLAGVGYALTCANPSMLSSITGCLISLWSAPGVSEIQHNCHAPPLECCAMVLRVFEFAGASGNSKLISEALLEGDNLLSSRTSPLDVRVVKVMAATGLLRGGTRVQELETMVTQVAVQLREEILGEEDEHGFLQRIGELQSLHLPGGYLHHLRCLSFALASCRSLQPHPALMHCLAISLLGDVLNLSWMYSASSSDAEAVVEKLEKQASGILFMEVGGIARALCEQHGGLGSALHEQQMEEMFWSFAWHLHVKHRAFAVGSDKSIKENQHLAKVLEAVFLSVILFFSSSVNRKRLVPGDDASGILAVRALDAFSCVEFLRRIQVPEYFDTVKACVSLAAASNSTALQLVNSFPHYKAINIGHSEHPCHLDDVQTSRVHFYLRVLPSFLHQVDDAAFEAKLAPVVFLYMCHPNKQVAEASHSLFALFVSREVDSSTTLEKEASLAEKLGVFYITRSLEGYPQHTSYEGLVTGITTIARYLPAGSVTVLHAIDQLVKKAEVLFSASDRVEDAQKLHTLLLHLLLSVDIQTLPWLMKQLAKLTSSLSPDVRGSAVRDTFAIIAGSEDIVRKPMLVPWFQSLAYLNKTSKL